MPTKEGELLSNGTFYLQNEDGTMSPFVGLIQAALLGATEGTINFVGDIPVVQEMTFSLSCRRRNRSQRRILKQLMDVPKSKRARERPIRRAKRRKEAFRRWCLKTGFDREAFIACVRQQLLQEEK